MKRVFPIFAVLVLVGVLALLNKTMNKGTGEDDAPPPTPPPAAKKAATAASDSLPPEISVGNAVTAPYKITVGWVYDDKNQASPMPLSQIIDAVRQRAAQSGGRVSAEIVNLDAPLAELSPQAASVTGLGVAVNGEAGAAAGGKEIALAGNPGEGEVSAANVGMALDALLAAKP